jgi:hypothetical protein
MYKHAAIILLVLFLLPALTPAQPVQLPYIFHDDTGSNWDVQYDGSIGDGGNDLYDGGGRLFVNANTQYNSPNQQATLDAARNELTFPPVQMAGLNVSRRVAVLPRLSTVRFTEIFENPTAAAVRIQVRCYFNLGGSLQQALPLFDKKSRQPLGYAIADQSNSTAMVGAGRGAKVLPRFNYQQNNDNVDIFYELDVPPKQTVAIVHFQIRRRTAPDSQSAWESIKERDLLRDVSRDMRRRIVNFPGGDSFIGDLEILRGDAIDIVELRGGDTYRGTLKFDQLRLQTIHGPVTLPAERVVSILNVGVFKPSQLIVTAEGEVFGGRIDLDHVPLQLTSGQLVKIPIGQVTRAGYRKRPGEPDEWNFDARPAAYLAGGERLHVKLPTTDYNLATPSGPIRLSPAVVSSIVFRGEDRTVPEVRLTDGSRISALLGASMFEMTLTGLGADQTANIPAAALQQLKFAPEQDTDHLTPTFTLANQDTLVGTVGGTLSLETPFDTLHIEGNEIKAISHARGDDHDVVITLWDDSTLGGRLVESHVTCLLKCGVSLRVPIALIESYSQPLPTPSPNMVDRIKEVVRDLDSSDWKVRDRAQAQILAIGPSVMSVLRKIQPTAPAEASQRIDLILHRLMLQLEREARGGGDVPARPQVENEVPILQ